MKIETIRHSLAHILAATIKELYPEVKFGIGASIENGFYYDFDFANLHEFGHEFSRITEKDLPKIEKKMKKLIKLNLSFEKTIIFQKEAKEIFKNQPYKLELIEESKSKKLSVYQSGNFIDFCKGPHIKSTSQLCSGRSKEIIDAFKLTRIAGAYWKGDEKKPMLTRIYGIAFKTKKEFNEYFEKQKEAEKRDHRIWGQKLELFLINKEVGQGLPIWLPKGAIIRKIIEDYIYQELQKEGYQWVYTPHIGSRKLWKISGHWNFYNESMYPSLEVGQSLEEKQKGKKSKVEEEYLLKPMNCPFHVYVYNSKIRSYRNLPVKIAELGTVYRYERSGTLHGLTRVRGFTQDDAHLICAADQMVEELTKLIRQALRMLKDFGFKEYKIYLSTRPEKYAGTNKMWTKATNALKYVLKKTKLKYEVDPGGGVFYGPKIDIKIKDSLEREWQCTTIQFDFNLPERFKMIYINKKGKKETPYMIHRAILGSLERFIGVLLEYYAGALPFWLSPEQIWIIPIASRHKKYAHEVAKKIREISSKFMSIREVIKKEKETVSKKIREGEVQKIPYLLVVGNKEAKNKTVRVRERGKGDIGEIKLSRFLEKIKKLLK